MLLHLTIFALLPLIASCVAPRAPAPAPAPARPAATPRPAGPAATTERFAGDWSSAPLSAGAWRYSMTGGTSQAVFGTGDATTLVIRCTSGFAGGQISGQASGQISIARSGVVPADMAAALNIRTSFAERQLPIRMLAGLDRMVGATVPATDPLFDQIIYSRGRFVIEATRMAPLVVPTRPEIARVIEDCRG